jgi:hypothetical protein
LHAVKVILLGHQFSGAHPALLRSAVCVAVRHPKICANPRLSLTAILLLCAATVSA